MEIFASVFMVFEIAKRFFSHDSLSLRTHTIEDFTTSRNHFSRICNLFTREGKYWETLRDSRLCRLSLMESKISEILVSSFTFKYITSSAFAPFKSVLKFNQREMLMEIQFQLKVIKV
jgi:hypothetical protein